MKVAYVIDYRLDKSNSTRAQKQTRLDPGWPGELGFDVTKIEVEFSAKELRALKVGAEVKYEVGQKLDVEGDQEDYFEGELTGTIGKILASEDELKSEDDEVHAVELEIVDGVLVVPYEL